MGVKSGEACQQCQAENPITKEEKSSGFSPLKKMKVLKKIKKKMGIGVYAFCLFVLGTKIGSFNNFSCSFLHTRYLSSCISSHFSRVANIQFRVLVGNSYQKFMKK